MDYIERQNAFVAKHKLKIGDKVKVFRDAEMFELGWQNSWSRSMMDATVGKTLTIGGFNGSSGIYLSKTGCNYPYFVLKPAKLRLG